MALPELSALVFAATVGVVVEYPDVPSVRDIAQTPDGYIWFGGQAGLYRHDGVRSVRVPTLSEQTSVRRVLAAADGSLWCGLGGGFLDPPVTPGGAFSVGLRNGAGGLVRLTGTKVEVVLAADGSPRAQVWALDDDAHGGVWIGTEDGVLHIMKDGSRRWIDLGDDGARNFVSSLVWTDDGVWVGTAAGVARLSTQGGGDLRWLHPERSVRALAADLSGRIWAGFLDGWGQVGNESDGSESFHAEPYVNDILAGDDGSLLIATGQRLLDVKNGEVRERMPSRMRSQSPRGLMRDREGSVWLGTNTQGLVQLRNSGIRNIDRNNGLPGKAAKAILGAADGSMWVTTDFGVGRYQGGRWASVAIEPRSRMAWPALAPASDAKVWVGAGHLLRMGVANGRLTIEEFEQVNDVQTLLTDGDGHLWIANRSGELLWFVDSDPTRKPERFDRASGICGGRVEFIAQDGRGALWLAGRGGLSRLYKGEGQCWTDDNRLPGQYVTSVYADQDNVIWLTFADARGVVRIQGDLVTRAGLESELPDAPLYAITEDADGWFWITSAMGVFVLPRSSLVDGPTVSAKRLDRTAGLVSGNFTTTFQPGAAIGPDGHIWFATAGGITIIAPLSKHPLPKINPLIESISVNGIPVGEFDTDPIDLGSGVDSLAIDFTAPSFLNPRAIEFEYRLRGSDASFRNAEGIRSARYGKLQPGDFTFLVKSEGASTTMLRLKVRPLFHESWWFRGGGVLLALLAVLVYLRVRVARVRARLLLVQDERERIGRELHDGLAQLFMGIDTRLVTIERTAKQKPELVQSMAKETREIVSEARQETRSAVWRLYDEAGETPFDQALGKAVERLQVELNVRCSVKLETRQLPRGKAVHELLRVVQEASTNAVRHGEARHIQITARLQGGYFELRVQDDGTGTDEQRDPSSNGFGLKGMQHRAEQLGGVLTVSKGEGTTVLVSVPLKPGVDQSG